MINRNLFASFPLLAGEKAFAITPRDICVSCLMCLNFLFSLENLQKVNTIPNYRLMAEACEFLAARLI